ncbi:murein L,D-transpeptidase [Psychrobacter sp. N25K4-3-2]|uniref:L,D-transpeptidase family protein n=1 Tax=Psychrobacter sp. N25K4-3-2 TaxID=2785026 RepID=UPI00188CAA0D|nr:L,D-transpeptidase family protein [Psychrobacter sp. N25K4-3-2]MBF4488733.1 murein L,D-transpeptidase [Psychrobacter sp. N25K4-3-2]
MYQLTKISTALLAIGLSTTIFIGQSVAATTENMTATDESTPSSSSSNVINTNSTNSTNSTIANESATNKSATNTPAMEATGSTVKDKSTDMSPVTNGVSQKLTGKSKTTVSLNKFLPTIKYSTENLPEIAQKVNSANWQAGMNINRNTGTKLQALLNWQHSGVGPVDGYWGKNTRKAMQAFQKANGLTVTETLNTETWQALTKNDKLMAQPVLVSYQLTEADVNIKTTTIPAGAKEKAKLEGMYYESVTEGLAEKFHISEKYLKSLNPTASFSAGETITVYNPGNPNTKPVSRVVADRVTETLYAYDAQDNLVASYPTTVGSTATPSPTGTHTVEVKVHEPNYTYTADDGSKAIIPPGPNNPVGMVWIGLSKPSYGIHGSPDPARISRQASAGCVRLTNWDALALLGVIQNGATVEFK